MSKKEVKEIALEFAEIVKKVCLSLAIVNCFIAMLALALGVAIGSCMTHAIGLTLLACIIHTATMFVKK